MTNRIVEIAEEAARLKVEHENLVIERHGAEIGRVPVGDLAALVVAHPRVSMTHPVLAGVAEAGGMVVVCNRKHLPVGMVLPLEAHHAQTARFARQAALSKPVRKRLWQQVVRAKIAAQAKALETVKGHHAGLPGLMGRVRSGDPQNVEAQAARRYWSALFGSSFRRNRDAEDINRHLNYGYAILRACVARAVCASGLHPSLGFHHHNRANAFALADDLMEPYRPLIDGSVARLVRDWDEDILPFDRPARRALMETVSARYEVDGEWRTLFDTLARVARSLASVVDGDAKALRLPAVP